MPQNDGVVEGMPETMSPIQAGGGRDAEGECLLRAADLQEQLGLSRAKVYRLMRDRVLPTVRIGGSVRVPRKALAKWIEDHTSPGTA